MKQLYLTLMSAAAIAFTSFGAKAFTVDEIVGTYNATDMDFSDSHAIFSNGALSGLESVSWNDMSISIVEGNKIKITNFIKKGINNGIPNEDGVFDIEGDFDPATNTITFQPTGYIYSVEVGKMRPVIAKYAEGEELEAIEAPEDLKPFTATFDDQKNLTVSPWMMYVRNSALDAITRVGCTPKYKMGETEVLGTRFTPAKQDEPELSVNDIVGTYNATDIDLSQNFNAFKNAATVEGQEAVSWEMTISIVQDNRVKLTNFLIKGINDNEGVFDLEGTFDPSTRTITFDHSFDNHLFNYPIPGIPSFMSSYKKTIAKYDGETELNTPYDGEYENFTATFDENKNLTVDPWALYNFASQTINLIPQYTLAGEKYFGTYFTPAGQSGLDDIYVEEVEDENAPVEYFNLQGVKVENPGTGMYIRRQGKKVQKVIIR